MSASAGRILIVDDESSIRRALLSTLSSAGFSIVEAETGEEAIALTRTAGLDAVLLDLCMPGMGGLAACREIRHIRPRLPILVLTVRDNEDEKVDALDAGADDYITKPFHFRELTARLRSAVRRGKAVDVVSGGPLRVGEIDLDPACHVVQKRGIPVHLTPKEFDMLHYLMAHAGQPVPHARLLSAVWGPEFRHQVEYLRTFMRQLRKKLEDDPAQPSYLLTDALVGYRLKDCD